MPATSIKFSKEDWEEILYAVDSKLKAVEAGLYGYADPEGDDEEWIEQFQHICDTIDFAIENEGEVDSSSFSDKDWAEIYYACESKINGIERGFFGPEEKRGENKAWIKQLRGFMSKISKNVSV